MRVSASTSADGCVRAPDDLRLTGVAATPSALTTARERLTTWCRAAGLAEDEVNDVELATYEAMANVVDHAYGEAGGTFDLHACQHDEYATVTVTDHGAWKPPARGSRSWRGRGLLIIERATREFELTPHARGTRVCMSWRRKRG